MNGHRGTERNGSHRRSVRIGTQWRARLTAVLAAAVGLLAITGCGVTSSNTSSTASAAGGGSSGGSSSGGGVVAMLMSDNNTARWFQIDVPNVTKAIHQISPGTKVMSYNANSSPATQLAQARTAIGQGAKVLVVTSVDPKAAGSVVSLAHRSGVKVIAYEHQILNSPVDYFVGFDPTSVGEQEGKWVAANTKAGDGIVLMNGWNATSLSHVFREGYMKALDPSFKSGARQLVGEVFTPQWLASNAQNEMQSFLTKGKPISTVLSENDQMAGGVVAALKGAGKAGKVQVTGLDSDVAALQRILNGTQSMTVHPEFGVEAMSTAKIAAALVAGKTPDASVVGTKTFPNGVGNEPWVVVPTTVITKKNMQLLIKEGYVTKAALCQGVPKTGPCA